MRQDTKILFATVSALSDVSDPCPKRAASFARLQNSSAERERVDAEILNGSFEGELFIKKTASSGRGLCSVEDYGRSNANKLPLAALRTQSHSALEK